MRSAPVVAIACLLASCANLRPRGSGADAAYWPALPPATLGAERVANQRLHAAFRDREVSLDCAVKVSAGDLTVIGLLPGGPRVFTVEYDGAHLTSQKTDEIPEAMRPQLLLNDLQLTLWPLPALQSALEHSDWTVTQADARTRRLMRGGLLVAEVHYTSPDPWTGRSWLVNFEHSYSITIDSQSLE